jgi:epoxyqueuosine reductase
VRGAAIWALGRLDPARFQQCASRQTGEADPEVIAEWAMAQQQ